MVLNGISKIIFLISSNLRNGSIVWRKKQGHTDGWVSPGFNLPFRLLCTFVVFASSFEAKRGKRSSIDLLFYTTIQMYRVQLFFEVESISLLSDMFSSSTSSSFCNLSTSWHPHPTFDPEGRRQIQILLNMMFSFSAKGHAIYFSRLSSKIWYWESLPTTCNLSFSHLKDFYEDFSLFTNDWLFWYSEFDQQIRREERMCLWVIGSSFSFPEQF